METDPAKRFSSAGQLAAALSECLGTAPPSEFTQTSSATSLTGAEKQKRPLVVRLAIALVVFGAIAAYKAPAVRRLLHLGTPPVATGISSTDNDQYIKAQELLKKSYKDANVADAVTIFKQILRDNPKFALAEAGLGSAYFTQYRNSHDPKLLDLAKEATDKSIAMQPDLAPAYATRARIEATAGNTDIALQDAQSAVSKDSRSPEALAALAEAYNALGRKPEAIEQLQNAIAIDDKNTMLLVRLGNYYKSSGDLAGAAAEWQKAVEIDPENTFAYYDLGIANMRLDKLADARRDLQKVLQIAPDADSYHTLGSILTLEGNFNGAIEMEKKALAIDPTNQGAWADLGNAYIWSSGRREDIFGAFSHAIDLAEMRRLKTPNDSQLLAELANYYASIGDGEKSGPLARKALLLSPDDPEVLYTLGDAYELLGQRPRAIQLIAKALAQGVRVNEFQRSPELASLRSDPSFAEALRNARNQSAVDSAKKIN
jgi:tetratricopeptide (TPR) repeat protein